MVEKAKKFKNFIFNDTKTGRGSKSQLLNDDLTQIQNHMEHVRAACQTTTKKLIHSMQSHGQGDHEKRQARLTENALSKTMSEVSKPLLSETETNSLLGTYLDLCAQAQSGLSKQKALHELFLDEQIVSPLQKLVDSEIPAVFKQRDKLKKLTIDRDKAEKSLEQARQNANSVPPSKIDALKDEADEVATRWQQCKDQFITDVFEYLPKEADHTQRIADFHAQQLEYHRKCVELLEKLQPEFESARNKTPIKKSFGIPLYEHLSHANREIALPLEVCVVCLLHLGLKEEGIFRLPGGAGKLKMMKLLLDGGVTDLHQYDLHEDIHAVAGALKQYLRELPEPLLTHELYQEWMDAAIISDHEEKLKKIWMIIDKLPDVNNKNFRYLMKFLKLIESHQDVNKMTSHNLAVVISPNLLWSSGDDMNQSIAIANSIGNIVECVIQYCEYFFPEEINFEITPGISISYQNLQETSPPIIDDASHFNMEHSPNQSYASPVSSSVNTPGKHHARTSSTELLNAPLKLLKKPKNKAPPPPPQTPTNQKVSAFSEKPMIAKRSSTKKPQGPPPNPPSHENSFNDEGPQKTLFNNRNPGAGRKPPVPEKPILTPHKNGDAYPDSPPPPPDEWLTTDLDNPPESGVDNEGNVYTAL